MLLNFILCALLCVKNTYISVSLGRFNSSLKSLWSSSSVLLLAARDCFVNKSLIYILPIDEDIYY